MFRRKSLSRLEKLPPPSRYDAMNESDLNLALETSLMQAEGFHRALGTDAPKDVALDRLAMSLEAALQITKSLQRKVEIRAKDW